MEALPSLRSSPSSSITTRLPEIRPVTRPSPLGFCCAPRLRSCSSLPPGLERFLTANPVSLPGLHRHCTHSLHLPPMSLPGLYSHDADSFRLLLQQRIASLHC